MDLFERFLILVPQMVIDKSTIRKQQLARRRELGPAGLSRLSNKLLAGFKSLDLKGIHTIHIFLPIEQKFEPDTFLLIDWLQTEYPDIHILVPKADFSSSLMTHHYYTGREALEKNIYNILEPINEETFTGRIDMVIVPLLAFDDRGYRVGYGKGFYDRFLTEHPSLKVGLSFFESVGTIADTHENDVRLDLCITPEEIIVFT